MIYSYSETGVIATQAGTVSAIGGQVIPMVFVP